MAYPDRARFSFRATDVTTLPLLARVHLQCASSPRGTLLFRTSRPDLLLSPLRRAGAARHVRVRGGSDDLHRTTVPCAARARPLVHARSSLAGRPGADCRHRDRGGAVVPAHAPSERQHTCGARGLRALRLLSVPGAAVGRLSVVERAYSAAARGDVAVRSHRRLAPG